MKTEALFQADAIEALRDQLGDGFKAAFAQWMDQRSAARSVGDIAWQHAEKLGREIRRQSDALEQRGRADAARLPQLLARGPWQLGLDWIAYVTDAMQRQTLVADTLRQRGNTYAAHQAAGMPPVLDFAYDVIVDGHTLARPVNYTLLRIRPPAGTTVDDGKRPFMIVDPRAGHGAGIGGFKAESQVGEAFADGHPVYFVAFRPVPEPGQTLADVRDAEIEFLREIGRRHPGAPHPAVIGNCQGGWATMLLAASAPELVGAVVINGAPMSYWAGRVGENPMRYMGGLFGGALPAVLASDLGAGVFDGSALVSNFESLNPANSLFRKLYNLYSAVDTEAPRFLEFERWWGGFFLMNEAEIRWIVENLFVGNRLARGEARLGDERIDLRRITAPVIVFASHGDNITPPQQALNWIADLYRNADEIKARGQRIVYMLHKSIGHLGIFVSGKIAAREHDAITDTMRAVEALPPGLYEMVLADGEDRMHVRYEPRDIADILQVDDGREDEALFASVARLSELATEIYDLTARPFVKAAVTPEAAAAARELALPRLRNVLWSDRNPLLAPVAPLAEAVREQRQPVSADNPFLAFEHLLADGIENQLNLFRDWRDGWRETLFHSLWGTPAVKQIGRSLLDSAEQRREQDVRALPVVRAALAQMSVGGAAEGTVRMLSLLARARGYERRSRLEREVLAFRNSPLLAGFDEQALARLVHEQSIAVDFEPEQALATLPLLLDTPEERRDALATLLAIAGPREQMHPAAQVLLERFEAMLGMSADAATELAGAVARETDALLAQAAAPLPAPAIAAMPLERAAAAYSQTASLPAPLPAQPAAAADDANAAATPRAPSLLVAVGAPDDLKALRGVGPRMADKLAELGITQFAQLAALQPAEVAWLDLKLEARGRVLREGWIDQARELVAGLDEFEDEQ
ncbi:DUF3141 domain-containing protein [Derxia lacustris]|uniref:DUF3141 domain-containing protein n=1 Tax=Derxia lacustris TaxID=764842 RepID=UPI001592B6E1|nr:DUF3141 domain-containing protein [Derxia lacustris]